MLMGETKVISVLVMGGEATRDSRSARRSDRSA